MSADPLTLLLEAKEKEIGREVNQHKVESIRDNVAAIELPTEIVGGMTESRGYQVLDA